MRLIQRLKSIAPWVFIPLCILVLFTNCDDAGVLEGDEQSSVTPQPASNGAPIIIPTENMNLQVGDRIQYEILADDDFTTNLSYSATGLPPGLSLNSQNGMLSGMVREVGNHSVNIQVSDGTLSTADNFNVSIIANQGIANMTANRAAQTPVIDGNLDEYRNSRQLVLTNSTGGVASYSILYDNQYIYFAGQIWDTNLNVQSLVGNSQLWNDDSIELMLDGAHNAGATRSTDDYKFFVNVANNYLVNQANGNAFNLVINSALDIFNLGNINQNPADTGYSIELRVPWAGLPNVSVPQAGTVMGFEMSFNDRFPDGTDIQTFWNNSNGGGPNDPDGWGDLIFQ